MADDWQSLADLAATPADNDEVLVKDTSDTTDDAVGTVKRNSYLNVLGPVLTGLRSAFTPASAAGPASLAFAEDTDNGSNTVSIAAPAAVTSDRTATLQDVTGTLYVSGGTDVAVADGGTGASDAPTALANLGAAPLASPTFTGTVTLPAAQVTYANIQNVAGLAVMGRTANNAGVVGNITAVTDGHVLRRSGTTLAFGLIPQGSVTNLTTDLGLKAPLDSPTFTTAMTAANPTFTGTVTVPDGALAIADTSGLQTALDLKAPLDSPTFTTALTAANPTFTGAVTIPDGALAIADTSGLQTALDAKAPAANPIFTGTVTVPDGALAIADTSGLQSALDLKAPLASPTFTGTVTVPSGSISYGEIQNVSASDRLLGRDTAAAGVIEELTVSGGLEFTGGPGIQRSALTGEVTAAAGSGATTIANDAVTYAKMQNVSAASLLLGRGSAAGAGDPQEITLGTNLTMSGTTLNAAPGGGGGDVTKVGTPADNQLGVWTGNGTIEGDTNLTWSGTLLTVTGGLTVTGAVTLVDGSLAIADTAGLQTALDAKAPLASPVFTTALTAANPTFTGTVTIPDGALAIADTSGLQTALDAKAPLASPTFTTALTAANPTFTGTVVLPNDQVSYAEMQNVAALSVLGNDTNATADPAEITAGTDGHVLRRSGTTLGFGTLATAGIADAQVTYAKIQNVAGLSVVGRTANTSGVGADVTAGTDGDVLRRSGTALGFGTIPQASVTNLTTDLGLKAPLASPTFTTALTAANPTFTGTVTVPDGALAIADTAGLQTALDAKAPTLNATFTGTFTVPNDAISYAEIQNVSATDRLLGRDTAAAGDIEELTVTGGLEFTGGPGIQRSALTGDVTATAGSNATTIAAGVVTYAKIQNVSATDRLLGRSTAGAGVVEEITCTATGRSILDDTTTAAVLTTIGALPLAGGTLTGALTLGTGASIAGGDKVASALEIKDVGETAPAAGSITGSITRDFSVGAVQELTLTGNVSALAISNPPASGIAGTITFIINHGTGPFTWAHPSGIRWPGAVAPTMSSGASDISIVSYMTRDGGTTWYGLFSGADFS